MQILFQLPKNLTVASLPKNASIGTEFTVDGTLYHIELGVTPDAGVLVGGVLHKIDALYIVKPK
ncbi:hypothetical protein NERG_02578 [Nematocida ausubeli]|uniref:Uncharacterized protein n=1 Tax=Nematocida ausubeli (strain ATCC PRA-371 / ERTm2) TaxID=1913371 RepID=H8ZG57_NEMA1|nr:hypothetical protein NERG_02578 [Nematocida ausubeli]KAI5134419.1 hypothetical protein NEAUS06_1059 [Nematocida ausubeli]